MKKTLSYPELWKQKQRELPVKGSPDAEWQKMRVLLDQRLPVAAVTKKPSRFKVPKWGLKMFVAVSTVAAVYVGSRLYLPKKHQDTVKPALLQTHRDSLAPAVKSVSSARDAAGSAIRAGKPGFIPIVSGVAPRLIDHTKLNNDTSKSQRIVADSIRAPSFLDIPVHRDSLLSSPAEAVPLKPVRDSISPVDLSKKDAQKDTQDEGGKSLKKKKRRKVSIFY